MKYTKASEKQITNLGFLEHLGEGIIIVDQERVIRAVNNTVTRLVGWTEAEIVGKYCFDFLQCHSPLTATSLCQNLCPLQHLFAKTGNDFKTGQIVYQDVMISTKSGEKKEVSCSFAFLDLPLFFEQRKDGDQAESENTNNYSIIVMRDITESKRQERIKTEFVATASHQLRTPLSSIKTSINVLLEQLGEDFSPPLLRLLQNILNSSRRMERLVNDLIELTNLQSGRVQLQPRPFEAHQLVKKALEVNRERLEMRQQSIKLDVPPQPLYVVADYARISQVLGHLISNASKFSAAGKSIEIQIEAGTGSEVIFKVRDEGIGIAPEEQSLVFEKFYQSQVAENSQEAGGGLGLPMAKALVELNGGRLWLESILGQGSTFYFSLPTPPPRTAQALFKVE